MSKIPQNYLPEKQTWPQYLTPAEFSETPDKLNLADFLLDRHVREGRGDNVAIRFMDKEITFAQLQKMVNQFGNALKDAGVEPQDRVGIRLVNTPQALVTIFAIEKIGAIPVPTSPLWSREEIAFVVNNAEVKLFVVNAPLMEQVEAAKPGFQCGAKVVVIGGKPEEVKAAGNLVFEEMLAKGSPELEATMLNAYDIGVILYTSGTTGMPKGCVHFIRPTVIETRMVNKHVYQLKPGDILGGAAPVSFAAGFGTFALIPFEGGAGISLIPKFSPPDMMELIPKHKITVLTGLPTAYRALMKFPAFKNFDISSVRLYTAGGDALGAETLKGWIELTGKPIWEGLGGTEMLHLVTSNTLNEQPVPNSIGKALPGVDVMVIDALGQKCKPGEVGSMIVRGPSGTLYWRPEENGGRLFRSQKSGVVEGWNKMGDAVYMAEDGNIFFVAREDDMIKSSGYRIAPAEIEETMAKHPAIADVGIVGIPDPEKGQIVKAAVELKPGFTGSDELTEEIKTFLKEYIAVYKLPRIIQYMDKLPRTPTGKLLRRMLR
ncbi:MAG: acyl-CoA synthetase [Syntrophobacteraceae bacterium]